MLSFRPGSNIALLLTTIFFTQPLFAAGGFLSSTNSGCKVWDPEIAPNESVKYIGNCKEGLADGVGIAEWSQNGKVTEIWNGSFLNGFVEGWARVKNDEYEHIGLQIHSEWNGSGKKVYSQGAIAEGTFRGNLLNGFGKIIQNNGTIVKGMFVNSRLNGYGEVVFKNGGKYEGEFSNGVLNGYGISTQGNGGKYEGYWRNGKYDGIGILFNPDGTEMPISLYSDGKFVGFADSNLSNRPTTAREPATKSLIEQEIEFHQNFPIVPQTMGGSSAIRLISPNGKVSTGIIWSNQQPGLLGGGTFIKFDK